MDGGPESVIGKSLAHYRVVSRLGAGGMGEVYLADDTRLERRVALKILPRGLARDPERLARFKREARVLGRLNHPNIVTVHAIERDDGVDFLVMEYVRGKTLAAHVPEGGLDMREFFSVAIALADALTSAHEAGIVHRDLKPANIMIDERGVPKILDFGIAKLTAWNDAGVDTRLETEALTADNQILGTAPFMAPEQLQGRAVDERSDIFSLGIVLYQMATGKSPFSGDTNYEVVSSILRDDPTTADRIRLELPHHLGRIIRHCLEKDPDKRLQSAKDLRNALTDLERELTVEQTQSVWQAEKRPRPVARWHLLRPTLPVVALLLVAVSALIVWQLAPGASEEPAIRPAAQQLLDEGLVREMRGHTRENLDAAAERYRRALVLDPDSGAIRARLAATLSLIHTLYPEEVLAKEVRALAAEALEQEDGIPLAHVALGRVLLLEGDAEAAEQEARRAIRAAPAFFEGHGLLGQAMVHLDRIDEGLAALGRATELAGSDVRGRLMLANELMGLERYDEAAAEYVKIRQYDPDYPDALNNLAVIYTRTGRDVDAVPLFKRLLQLDDRDEAAAQGLGVVYFNLGRYEEAVEAFETSHRIDPSKPTAPHALGETWDTLGDEEAARGWYAKAISGYDADIQAGGPRSYNLGLRAFCAAKLGRFDEAKQNIREAIELDPGSGYRRFNAAQVSALAGEREEAFRHIADAVEAGYARREFLRDPAFEAYQDDPEFLALVESD